MVWRVSLSVAGGNVDYIEVRTSEVVKGRVLEKAFPARHWTGENPEALVNAPEFDFLRNAERVGRIIADYLEHAVDDVHAQCWADKFMKTYEVGESLQKLGLHPRVSIG